MRWVECAAARPHRCAVIPFVGADREGFIDTGSELPGWDPHVYVSVTAVREMARFIGLPEPGVCERLVAERDAVAEQLDEARRELEDAQRQLHAVGVLKQAGYTASRKPGRPPKEKVA